MGFIYLMYDASNDDYKIGTTKNSIDKRKSQLQTGNSEEIIIKASYTSINYIQIETIFHRNFSHKNTRGEWFYLSSTDVSNFEKICMSIDAAIESLKNNTYLYKDILR